MCPSPRSSARSANSCGDIDALYELVERMDQKIDSLDTKADQRIDSLDAKLDRRFDEISGQFAEVLQQLRDR